MRIWRITFANHALGVEETWFGAEQSVMEVVSQFVNRGFNIKSYATFNEPSQEMMQV